MKLLITDLDNTLYDWVTYFVRSFDAMLVELGILLATPEDELRLEFREVHRRYGNTEHPFAALEIPAVERRFPGTTRSEKARLLERPFQAYNDARRTHLHLYETVDETLAELRRCGVRIVGHTESIVLTAHYRLVTLGVARHLDRLYCLEGKWLGHPVPEREALHRPPEGFAVIVPRAERKPNRDLLLDICRREGVTPEDAVYVGDSLSRDVMMARQAGVCAVWAEYGTRFEPELWQSLGRVSHWTDEDIARDARLRELARDFPPDHTIERFAELIGITAAGAASAADAVSAGGPTR